VVWVFVEEQAAPAAAKATVTRAAATSIRFMGVSINLEIR
jgi:hypothetical protein